MDDFSIPERCSFPAFHVPSASERGDESDFMGLQNAAEVNPRGWLLKSDITWPGPFNRLQAILHPQVQAEHFFCRSPTHFALISLSLSYWIAKLAAALSWSGKNKYFSLQLSSRSASTCSLTLTAARRDGNNNSLWSQAQLWWDFFFPLNHCLAHWLLAISLSLPFPPIKGD